MNNFPNFKRGELQEAYKKLTKKDKSTIEEFVKYVSIGSNAKTRLDNVRRGLTSFLLVTGRTIDQINLNDLRTFLSLLNSSPKTNCSRNDIKHTVKRFLRWHFKDWSEKFDNLSDIKLVMKINEEKINADTILHKEDVEKIMKAESSLFWKTFFITLYESGLRPNELRNLKWKNIHLNSDGDVSELNIYATKTHRARSVYVKEATRYLTALKQKQQDQNLDTELLFPSPKNKDIPINKSNASLWLGRISKKVLGRSVHPYMLRHSRATELYTNAGIPAQTAQKFLGHSKSMGDVYTHLSNKDVREALSKTIYQTEEVSPEKKAELERRLELLESFIKRTFGEGGSVDITENGETIELEVPKLKIKR
jgi:integrase